MQTYLLVRKPGTLRPNTVVWRKLLWGGLRVRLG
jgi:hypothetical protein